MGINVKKGGRKTAKDEREKILAYRGKKKTQLKNPRAGEFG